MSQTHRAGRHYKAPVMLNNLTDGPIRDCSTFRAVLHPKRSKPTGTVSVLVGRLGVCDLTEGLTITDRQTNKQTDGRTETDGQTDGQTERRADRQTGRQTDRQSVAGLYCSIPT